MQPRNRYTLSRKSVRQVTFEHLDERVCLSVTPGLNLSTGNELTSYRFALATTAEFTSLYGGVAATSAILDQIVSDLNTVFSRELAIELELIPNNDALIFTNAGTDGYSNGDAFVMATENQAVIDGVIGSANYDIGHVLGTYAFHGATGVGFLPILGVSPTASGGSIVSDPFHAPGILLHEIAHTLGAEHTFNGVTDSCAFGRVASNSYEPGSGSTIDAYQGICGTDDVTVEDNDQTYYHTASFHQIMTYLNSIPAGTTSSTGNAIPVVDAGPNYTIPAATPFTLVASATDANSADVLTYTWEQIDAGGPTGQAVPIPNAADHVGPLFRSYAPTQDVSRTFPRWEDILANTPQATNVDEHLPTQSRNLNFRVTARDNHIATVGGSPRAVSGVDSDDVLLTVVNTGAPFLVTSPNTSVAWTGGSNRTITWNVAGTTANGINTANVRILLSTDGGDTFPIELATTANDGSHSLIMPNLSTTAARIKIEGVGNVFFDVSDADFSITPNLSLAGVQVTETDGSTAVEEAGSRDTYLLGLNTIPTGGAVSVTIFADVDTLVSLDGIHFAASQVATFDSTTPVSVSVQAVNDAMEEGPETSRIRHEITASSSASYPLSLVIQDVAAEVLDREVTPLVGVDFEFDCCLAIAPQNWAQTNFIDDDVADLVREDNTQTGIDLISTPAPGGFSHFVITAPPLLSTVPRHLPSLYGIGGSSSINKSLTMTWDDLEPGREYAVYVFGLDVDENQSFSQTVTITGRNGSLPSFNQTLVEGRLMVNGEAGDDDRSLLSYAKIVAADLAGNITVQLDPNPGSDGVSLGGIALGQLPRSSTLVTHWDFEGDANDRAVDGAKLDNATLSGANIVTGGIGNNAARFQGNGDVMTVATSPDINQNFSQKSISLWFFPEDAGSSTRQVIYQQGGTARGMNIYLQNGLLYAGAWNDSESWAGTWLTGANVVNNQWNHVVVTLDAQANELRLFLNDASPVSGFATTMQGHNSATLGTVVNGTRYTNGSGTLNSLAPDSFVGFIDDVRIFDAPLPSGDVASLGSASPAAVADIVSGLVTYWDFESNANDKATEGSMVDNGTLSGATLAQGGLGGGVARFLGNGAVMTAATSPDINQSFTQKSISLWFLADDIGSSNRQVIYQQGGTARGMNIYLQNESLFAGAWNDSAGWTGTWLSSVSLSGNDWNHVTFTFDSTSGELELFVNGNAPISGFASTMTGHNSATLGTVVAGTRFASGGSFVNSTAPSSYLGYLDDVRIYNRALTNNDADLLAAATPADVFDTTLGLVTYWDFTANANDKAPQGAAVDNGTLSGATLAGGGLSDGSVRFQNNGDLMSVATSPDINQNFTQKSIALWFLPQDAGNSNRQVIYQQGGTARGMNIYLQNGSIYIGAWNDSVSWNGTWLSSTGVLNNQWNHVTLTFDSDLGDLALYLNGDDQFGTAASMSGHNPATLGSVQAGTRFDNGAGGFLNSTALSSFLGYVDDVRIYNRVLRSNDVAALAAATPQIP